MNKAEDKAKKMYPLLETDAVGNNPYITYNTAQLAKQEGFIEGYRQAERYSKLTWEDMRLIDRIASKLLLLRQEDDKDFYQEVLKRFKERKER